MNNRLKELRLNLNLSQEEFGNKIGIKSRSHISALESGTRNITDRIISDIVREFHINENWLRTGEGEMFETLTKSQEWGITVGRILANENEFARKTFEGLSLYDDSDWLVLKKVIDTIYKKNE